MACVLHPRVVTVAALRMLTGLCGPTSSHLLATGEVDATGKLPFLVGGLRNKMNAVLTTYPAVTLLVPSGHMRGGKVMDEHGTPVSLDIVVHSQAQLVACCIARMYSRSI